MTDPTPNRPPLWEVMRDALSAIPKDTIFKGGDGFVRVCVAAQLRAIADWLVPEEDPFVFETGSADWFYQRNRERLRRQLRAEADRAEAGE
jgi:hypothetical protein